MTKPYVEMGMSSIASSYSSSSTSDNRFHCAVIDKQGNEVPITEQMIQSACRELEDYASSIYGDAFPLRNFANH